MTTILRVCLKHKDALKALERAVPSMESSFSINTAHGDLHFHGDKAKAVAGFVRALLEADEDRMVLPIAALESLGYQIIKDVDQPGFWLWKTKFDGSDFSFPSKDAAQADASRDALSIQRTADTNDCPPQPQLQAHAGTGVFFCSVPTTPSELPQLVTEPAPLSPQEIIMTTAVPVTVVRLTLEVAYDLNGTPLEVLTGQLNQVVEHAYANGLLTGGTEAEVIEHRHHISYGLSDSNPS